MMAPATETVRIREKSMETKFVAIAVQVFPIKKITIKKSRTWCRFHRLAMDVISGVKTA